MLSTGCFGTRFARTLENLTYADAVRNVATIDCQGLSSANTRRMTMWINKAQTGARDDGEVGTCFAGA